MGSNPIQIDSQGYMELTSSTYDNVGNSVMTGTTNLLNILISFLPIMVGIFVTWLIVKKGIPFLVNLFHISKSGGNNINKDGYNTNGNNVIVIDKTKKGGFNDFS